MRRLEIMHRVLDRARERRGVALMGVCNVTPDSFSDGGLYYDAGAARARVDALLSEGADLVDIGGESTRPRAAPVSPREQLGRILDVVRYAAGAGACVTVDTASAEVAVACLDAGACGINDVSCLADAALARAAAEHDAALVLSHARGTQQAMPGFSQYPDDAYGDVVADVLREWRGAAGRAAREGLAADALIMDPGLGFAKNARQSLELLCRTKELVGNLEVPVAIGASRKSFLALADREAGPAERLGASVAAAIHAAGAGAAILRVHDVRATRQAIDLLSLLRGGPPLRSGPLSGGPADP
jgi:dihydropteroate synthase